MKILVVAPSWIGDTIIAQPLLSCLHERHPGVVLDVLAAAWSAPLLARMPEVRRSIDNPFGHGRFDPAGRRRFAQGLKAERYDQAIVLPNSWKSALIPFFAGIPRRTGYRGEWRLGLINDMHRLDSQRHPRLVDRYLGLAGGACGPSRPRLQSSPEQQRAAREALGLPLEGAPVVFCPGAEYGPAKRWPASHFAALAKTLARDGNAVWLVGSAKDQPVGEEIARASDGAAINLCGRTSLTQAIDLIGAARCVVSNDSGLMHVAAALDKPLTALFGSSSIDYTPPVSPQANVVTLGLGCSPCFKRECPLGHLNCLTELTPERVLASMRS